MLDALKKLFQDEITDTFLEHLLYAMDLAFSVSSDYRENINDFSGRYLFKNKSGTIAAGVEFGAGEMTVYETGIDNPTVSITFSDGKALRDFLFSDNPDLIAFMFENRVSFSGNFNYLLKFSYMANRLKTLLHLS